LEEAAITRFADTVMGAVPWSTDAITDFPLLLTVANRDNGAYDFVARDSREGCSFAECALLEETIGVTYTASVYFDQDFALFGMFDGNLFDSPRCTRLLDDDSATGLGDIWCHFSAGLGSTQKQNK
jgi:hypothetical protein